MKSKTKTVVWGICWKDKFYCSDDIFGTTIQVFKTRTIARKWAKPHMRVVKLEIREVKNVKR